MTLSEEAQRPYPLNDYAMQIDENLVLGIKSMKEINGVNFFNHSCDPNIGIVGQIFFVAMRDIKIDEEACFDYAMVLYHSKEANTYKVNCLCGSKKCRGIITDDDWKNPELQKKYNGYFQHYIQEKINNN